MRAMDWEIIAALQTDRFVW